MIRIDVQKPCLFEQVGHRIPGDRKGQIYSRGVGREYLHLAIDDHSRLATRKSCPMKDAALACTSSPKKRGIGNNLNIGALELPLATVFLCFMRIPVVRAGP
jgi:hypothetical protein